MITERSQMKICGLSFVWSFISNRVAPGPLRGPASLVYFQSGRTGTSKRSHDGNRGS